MCVCVRYLRLLEPERGIFHEPLAIRLPVSTWQEGQFGCGLAYALLSTSINRISLLNNTFIPKGYISKREHTKESRKWLAIFYVVSIPTDDPFDRCLVQSYTRKGKMPMISYSWHSSDWYNLPSDMALVLVWWWWMCNTHTRPEIDIGCSYTHMLPKRPTGWGVDSVAHGEKEKESFREREGDTFEWTVIAFYSPKGI